MNAQLASRDPRSIPVSAIETLPGFNPRREFASGHLERLVDSIRENGLLTPITVRLKNPDDDREGYQLICGERRFRAVTSLGLPTIPALVIEADDAEALRYALIENSDRTDITPAEEALVSQRYVALYEGDYEAAARALGWPPAKLKHRLQLNKAAEPVLEALMQEKIALGHAELLAQLPEDAQLKALPRIIEHGVTIAMLKEQITGISIPLASATFDTASICAGCVFNSSHQGTLFQSSIGGGRCSNRPCFTRHTDEAIEAKRQAAKEDFAQVALVSEKPAGTTVPLVAMGQGGVGEAQMAACRGCAMRGALIEDRAGPRCGTLIQPVCFDTVCNATKAAEYAASLAPAPTEPQEATEAPSDSQAPSHGPSKAAPSTPKASAKAPAAKSTPVAVLDHNAAALQRTASEALGTRPEWIIAIALYGTLITVADTTNVPFDELVKRLGLPTPATRSFKRTKVLAAWTTLGKDVLQAAMAKASLIFISAKTTHGKADGNQGYMDRRALSAALVAANRLDIAPHVLVDADYLGGHTRAGIDQVLDESGFTAWLSTQDDGAAKVKALGAMKKPDLIKAVLDAGYDWKASGYVPSSLIAQVRDLTKSL